MIFGRKRKLKNIQEMQDLVEMREWAKVSEAIERADSEHCKALERETAAEQK